MNFAALSVGGGIFSDRHRDRSLPCPTGNLAARAMFSSWARHAGDDRILLTESMMPAWKDES
jgi:hypothetical protein